MITKKQFERYEAVRRSGVTNMFDISTVMRIARLSKDQCIEIMQNYEKLFSEHIGPMDAELERRKEARK